MCVCVCVFLYEILANPLPYSAVEERMACFNRQRRLSLGGAKLLCYIPNIVGQALGTHLANDNVVDKMLLPSTDDLCARYGNRCCVNYNTFCGYRDGERDSLREGLFTWTTAEGWLFKCP